jgi:hypothetical protein
MKAIILARVSTEEQKVIPVWAIILIIFFVILIVAGVVYLIRKNKK